MTSALSIAEQGHEVHLIEKDSELGGMARKIHSTLDGMDVQAYVSDLISKVYKNPLIRVYIEAVVTNAAGYVGNFVTTVDSERGTTEIKHGVTIVAIGVDVYEPTEYLYGKDDRVMTHLELEQKMVAGDEKVTGADTLVMIQCVGCRNEDRDYCSRICCQESVKNALALKEINPDIDIYILYRDMRTYGFAEDYYREARGKKVRFVRYVPEDAPVVEAAQKDGKSVLTVRVTDQTLKTKIAIDADVVALAAAVVPSAQARDISQSFGVSLGQDGFFKEAHVKLKPVEFAADGVYLCGTAHYPKLISEAISQAYGAAGRALTTLSHDTVVASGSVCDVDEKKCIGCGACVTACTYGAVELKESKQGKKAAVIPVLCKGCGLCNAKCPSAAIQLKHFTDDEILSQIDAAVPDLATVS
jgi:heterodisulfide reductase subunit A